MIMCKKQEKDKDEVIYEQKAAECKQKESKPKQRSCYGQYVHVHGFKVCVTYQPTDRYDLL